MNKLSDMLFPIYITLLLCGLAMCEVKKSSRYTSKYDNIDLDEVLHNDRLLDAYVKCLKSEGPCTSDAAELKRTLPDAIETDCSKCTERQKEGSKQVTHYLIDNKPDKWVQLEAIYDPSGSYKKKYLASKDKDVSIEPVKKA